MEITPPWGTPAGGATDGGGLIPEPVMSKLRETVGRKAKGLWRRCR